MKIHLGADPQRERPRRLNELPRCTRSRTESAKTDPKRAIPRMLVPLPTRAKLRRLSEDPRCRKSSTDKPLPRRTKLRSEIELANVIVSQTEQSCPTHFPARDSEEPSRMKLRRDMLLPICKKSSTEMLDPKREDANKASELPILEQLRRLRALPRCTKSITATALPRRPKDLVP